MEAWELLRIRISELQRPIISGINKIREYVNRTQGAAIHTLAMVVNLSLKFEWINQHWAPFDRQKAYDRVKAKMLFFQKESYERALQARYVPSSPATQSQNHGYLRVLTLSQNLRRASSVTGGAGSSSPAEPVIPQDLTNALPSIANGRVAPSPEDIRSHNLGAVEFELNRYIAAGPIPIEAMGAIALTSYWQANQFTYPLLYRIAMDVLPVQASSVSSERVFSSSKLTCTSERNRISTKTMEAFQVLKHSLYRRRREVAEPRAAQSRALDFVVHQFENLEIAD
ncbi:hypothetical protein RSOLAG22IIIB_07571 [Rhizoctonia solani]|uniref:HAT C-terminal dimerisation domain-containing protein n=1 Tax=Rhizoctonia solani TaxID=456999 RepID=A0A0K6FNY7_9AGAM|nr:hypothetical protein RSOLAG22IIIB_07571 [Rhizoctonia solani]